MLEGVQMIVCLGEKDTNNQGKAAEAWLQHQAKKEVWKVKYNFESRSEIQMHSCKLIPILNLVAKYKLQTIPNNTQIYFSNLCNNHLMLSLQSASGWIDICFLYQKENWSVANQKTS